MRILLINPPQVYNKGERPFVVFPLGLGYIAAALQKHNYNVEIIDCIGEASKTKTQFNKQQYLFGLRFEQICKRLQQTKPDLVLISCTCSLQQQVLQKIAAIVKEMNNQAKVVVGGNHASAQPKELLQNDNIDFVVLGEAEITITKLVEALRQGNSIHKIQGIALRRGRKVSIKEQKNNPQSLDRLPFPARHLFPFECYASASHKHTMLRNKGKVAEILSSRGCQFNCSYCASHVVSGRSVRTRSIDNVAGEIKYLIAKYGIKEFHFEDDNILFDKTRFYALCEQLSHLKIRWTVPNGLNVQQLDNEMIDNMKYSGCNTLFLAIESANKHVLKLHVDKSINQSHVISIVNHAKHRCMYTVGFFLLGFYEESKADIMNTVNYASKLGLDEAHFSIVSPLPGSRYYESHKKLITNVSKLSSKNAITSTKYLAAKEVETLRNWAYILFETRKMLHRPISYFDSDQISRITRYAKYLLFDILSGK